MSFKSIRFSRREWLAAAALSLHLANPVHSATFNVDQLADDDGGCTPGACSLREAALAANALPGVDLLILAPGVHELSIPGINEEQGFTGDINFREPVEIRGAFNGATVIDGSGIDGILEFFPFSSEQQPYLLRSVTLRGGDRSHHRGGAIYGHAGYLLVEDCVFEGNTAMSGGAVSLGNMEATIRNSSFIGNRAGDGGALARSVLGLPLRLLIENSTFSGNTATGAGGAIVSAGDGVFTLRSSTVADNTAPAASALHLVDVASSEWVVESSIIDGTCGWTGSVFPPTSLGGNVQSDDGSCHLEHPSDQAVSSPSLGPLVLSENGYVQELLPGSPAIDAALTCPNRDQRGAPRPLDGNGDGVATCDAGAYEFGTPTGLADIPSLGTLGFFVFAASLAAGALFFLRRG